MIWVSGVIYCVLTGYLEFWGYMQVGEYIRASYQGVGLWFRVMVYCQGFADEGNGVEAEEGFETFMPKGCLQAVRVRKSQGHSMRQWVVSHTLETVGWGTQ